MYFIGGRKWRFHSTINQFSFVCTQNQLFSFNNKLFNDRFLFNKVFVLVFVMFWFVLILTELDIVQ